MDAIKASGAVLMPVDSEHNAIFQCLVGATKKARCEANIILTCSGGPFRQRQDLSDVTVEEATHHPNWSMGKKITVDSATLMNKGLEVIEARWLLISNRNAFRLSFIPRASFTLWSNTPTA